MELQLLDDPLLENIATGRNKLLMQTNCGVWSIFTYSLICLFLSEDGLVGFTIVPCTLFTNPFLLHSRF